MRFALRFCALIGAFGTMPLAVRLSGNTFQWTPYLIGITALIFAAQILPRRGRWILAFLSGLLLTAELGNITALGRPIFYDQVLAFIESPINTWHTSAPYLLWWMWPTMVIAIVALTAWFGVTFNWIREQRTDTRMRSTIFCSTLAVIATFAASSATLMDVTYSSFPLFKIPQSLKYKHSFVSAERQIPTAHVTASKAPNILWIIGEGMDKEAMSLYGSEFETTPHLEGLLRDRQGYYYRDVMAPGKFTVMSHYLLLNFTDPEHFSVSTPSVFGYMKSAGYQTSYLSSRSLRWGRLNQAVSSGVDKHIDVRALKPRSDLLAGVDDGQFIESVLLPHWNESIDAGPSFVVWQMNGSHLPYADKSPAEFKKFDDEYLNSVLYSDHNLAKLLSEIDDQTWIFFISDHGKKSMNADTNQVPMFIIPPADTQPDVREFLRLNQQAPIAGNDISLTLARLAGHTTVHELSLPYFSLHEELAAQGRSRYSCAWEGSFFLFIETSSCQKTVGRDPKS